VDSYKPYRFELPEGHILVFTYFKYHVRVGAEAYVSAKRSGNHGFTRCIAAKLSLRHPSWIKSQLTLTTLE